MCPLLSASTCSITSSHFPLAISPGLPWAPGAEVWHNSPDISQKADWPWCCCCYAWCCSVLRRPQPWEHGALRNVGKYSFIQTHSLPAFVQLGSNTTSPPQPGKDSCLRLKKLTCCFSVTRLNHCSGWEQVNVSSHYCCYCVLKHLSVRRRQSKSCVWPEQLRGAKVWRPKLKNIMELEKQSNSLRIHFWLSPLLNWSDGRILTAFLEAIWNHLSLTLTLIYMDRSSVQTGLRKAWLKTWHCRLQSHSHSLY